MFVIDNDDGAMKMKEEEEIDFISSSASSSIIDSIGIDLVIIIPPPIKSTCSIWRVADEGDETRSVMMDASSSLASGGGDGDGEETVCYLCLDVGAEPLRRDCACHGTDAGFVHLSCLANYAETMCIQAHDMREFAKPWQVCSGCHQCYQNELAVDIATKCVPFVRRQYPNDTQRQVEALHLKLCALDSMFDVLQPVQKREAGVTANVILFLIGRKKEMHHR